MPGSGIDWKLKSFFEGVGEKLRVKSKRRRAKMKKLSSKW